MSTPTCRPYNVKSQTVILDWHTNNEVIKYTFRNRGYYLPNLNNVFANKQTLKK